ncbi:MAG: YncE family protein [Bacillota bacterium]
MLNINLKKGCYIPIWVLLILIFAVLQTGCENKASQRNLVIATEDIVKKKDGINSQKELERIAESQAQNKGGATANIIEWPEEALVVCLEATNEIAIVDLKKEKVVQKISVGTAPRDIVKSQDGKRIFVANSMSGEVTVLELDTGEIHYISMGSSPTKMVISRSGRYVYVVDYYLNGVRVLDTELLSLVKVLGLKNLGFDDREIPMDCCLDPLGTLADFGRGPSALALDLEGEMLYVGNIGTWDVAVVDLEKEWEVVSWDGVTGIRDMLIAGSPAKLYLAGIGSSEFFIDEIFVINLETGELGQKIKIGHEPIALQLDPNGKILYALAREGQKIAAIEVASGNILGTCEVGEGARDFALSDDGALIFVSHEEDGTVSVIAADSLEKTTTISVGLRPFGAVYLKQD